MNLYLPAIAFFRRSFLPKLVILALLPAVAWADDSAQPYDESADAKIEIKNALSDANGAKLRVLVVFGANWCGDCRALDKAFKGDLIAPFIRANFKVVKVNVGKFDRNAEIAENYGMPLKRGIPGLVMLSGSGKVLQVTRSGELASARKMGDEGIHRFVVQLASIGESNAP